MKKLIFFFTLIFLVSFSGAFCQMVRIEPSEAKPDDEVKLIFDAKEGGGELTGAPKVYVHSGLVTDNPNGTAWQHVIGNWGEDDGVGEMTPVEGETDVWEIILSPSVRQYYNAPEGINIFRLSMVFRSADGSTKASIAAGNFDWGFVAANGDIFVNLTVGPYVNILSPETGELFLLENESFLIKAEASESGSSLAVWVRENDVFEEQHQVASGQVIEYEYVPSGAGELEIKVVATINGVEVEALRTLNIIHRTPTESVELPPGLKKGINYAEDHSKVTLVLEAPEKDFVYVTGDFNNWELSSSYLMRKSPGTDLFWLEISGLEPQKEYVFQYWVDGTIKIGDPYAEKVADPWNDQHIPADIYPNLITYNRTENGVASVLQTAQEAYQWSETENSWRKAAKEELIIYELLLRDFLTSHSYKDLTDTLAYLKRLGVNAIELMPVMEFEGNDSWGYNPSYFFAPDKYYGTKNDLKQLIETAHQHGMAVILDMVLNHAFGQNPMVKMYWDGANNTVLDNSPWFNPEATHPFNVGFDFNHESLYTQNFVDSVNHYWLKEYHFDGFRFDLSKGFTQTPNPNDVGAWGAYDASRIALLKRMADKIWSHTPDAYIILEHFAENSEEKELAEYRAEEGKGMLLWGNLNHSYTQNTMGYVADSDVKWIYHASRDWAVPHVVGYMESHDEERLMVKNLEFGRGAGTYNIKTLNIAIERNKAASVFFYTVPGPKMLWQFGELGFDKSINSCTDGSISDNCRLSPKAPAWDYLNDAQRKSLYTHTSDLLRLRNTYDVFRDGEAIFGEGNALVKQLTLKNASYSSSPADADEMNAQIVVNFDVINKTAAVNFPHTGTWYDYYGAGQPLEVGSLPYNLTLDPGKYKLFTDVQIENPVVAGIIPVGDTFLVLYPNPANDLLTLYSGNKIVQKVVLKNLFGVEVTPQMTKENQWNISNISSGIYIVEVQISGKIYYSKIIKN